LQSVLQQQGQHIVALHHSHLHAWQAQLARHAQDLVPGLQRVGCAHIGDDARALLQADWQYSPHALGQQRVKAFVGVLLTFELRQRNGALGQALEHEVVELPVASELDGWRDAVTELIGVRSQLN